MSNQTVKEFVRAAEDQGWSVLRENNHIVLGKNGQRLSVSKTPSDHRAFLNMISDFKRIGGEWPPREHVKEKVATEKTFEVKGIPMPTPTKSLTEFVLDYLRAAPNSRSVREITDAARVAGYSRPEGTAGAVSYLWKTKKLVAAGWRYTGGTGLGSNVVYGMYTIFGRCVDVPKPAARFVKPKKVAGPAKVIEPVLTKVETVEHPSSNGFRAQYMDLLLKKMETADGEMVAALADRIEKLL